MTDYPVSLLFTKKFTVFLLAPVLILLFITSPAQAEPEEPLPDIQTIIDAVDRLYRSDSSFSELEMQVVSTHWERTMTMNIWTEGMDKTFIYITSPRKDRGIATLRIETEMWNYFPKINKVMKVPPSMMMGSWMGSDFTNDDLVKESSLLRDYDAELFHPEDENPDYYYISLTPKMETPTVWGKIVLTIRKEDYLPVTEVYFDEKGREMRILTFSEIRTFGSRTIPSVMEMIPLTKTGQKTVVRYKDVKFDEAVDHDVFTLRNLQKRR